MPYLDPSDRAEYMKRYRAKNKEQIAASKREWRGLHKEGRRAKYLAYQLAKINRVPLWANLTKIKEIYAEAQRLGLTVDHIIPLRGKLVSGLHVENNLQLLTLEDNLRKCNHYDYSTQTD